MTEGLGIEQYHCNLKFLHMHLKSIIIKAVVILCYFKYEIDPRLKLPGYRKSLVSFEVYKLRSDEVLFIHGNDMSLNT